MDTLECTQTRNEILWKICQMCLIPTKTLILYDFIIFKLELYSALGYVQPLSECELFGFLNISISELFSCILAWIHSTSRCFCRHATFSPYQCSTHSLPLSNSCCHMCRCLAMIKSNKKVARTGWKFVDFFDNKMFTTRKKEILTLSLSLVRNAVLMWKRNAKEFTSEIYI